MGERSEPEGGTGPGVVGPVDPLKIPRFAGPSTFARLPRRDQ
ncbi:MAG: agmatinase, partial [Actinomycetota bacterium]